MKGPSTFSPQLLVTAEALRHISPRFQGDVLRLMAIHQGVTEMLPHFLFSLAKSNMTWYYRVYTSLVSTLKSVLEIMPHQCLFTLLSYSCACYWHTFFSGWSHDSVIQILETLCPSGSGPSLVVIFIMRYIMLMLRSLLPVWWLHHQVWCDRICSNLRKWKRKKKKKLDTTRGKCEQTNKITTKMHYGIVPATFGGKATEGMTPKNVQINLGHVCKAWKGHP